MIDRDGASVRTPIANAQDGASGTTTESSEAANWLPLVYPELRRLAARRLAAESPDHTLQPTALVHEVYLRLAESSGDQHWDSLRHFYSAAAEAMRRILIESARRKNSLKRGGDRSRHEFHEDLCAHFMPPQQLLALDESLERFAAVEPVKAELVKLRYFAGMSHQEAARALGLSRATADRYWAYAKVWLFADIQDADTVDGIIE